MRRFLIVFSCLITVSTTFAYNFSAEKLGNNLNERLERRVQQSKKLLAVMNEQDDLRESQYNKSIKYETFDSQMTADLDARIIVTRQVRSTSENYFCDYEVSIAKRSKADIALIKCSSGIKPRPLND